jgi:hypothetical protein
MNRLRCQIPLQENCPKASSLSQAFWTLVSIEVSNRPLHLLISEGETAGSVAEANRADSTTAGAHARKLVGGRAKTGYSRSAPRREDGLQSAAGAGTDADCFRATFGLCRLSERALDDVRTQSPHAFQFRL